MHCLNSQTIHLRFPISCKQIPPKKKTITLGHYMHATHYSWGQPPFMGPTQLRWTARKWALLNFSVWRCLSGQPGPESVGPWLPTTHMNQRRRRLFLSSDHLLPDHLCLEYSVVRSDLKHTHTGQPPWGIEIIWGEWADAKDMPWRPHKTTAIDTHEQGLYLFMGRTPVSFPRRVKPWYTALTQICSSYPALPKKKCTKLLTLTNQRDIARNLSEWPKWKTLLTPSAGKNAQNLGLSNIASGNIKWYSYSRNWHDTSLQN